jgi:glutathione S-transferase
LLGNHNSIMFNELSNTIGVSFVIVVCAFFAQVLSTFVSIQRGKHKIKAPATTGHETFERAFRTHLNYVENLVVFLPIYIVSVVNSGVDFLTRPFPPAVFLIGCVWILSRIVGSLVYINKWKYNLGIIMYIISLLCILILLFISFSGMWEYINQVLEQGKIMRQ